MECQGFYFHRRVYGYSLRALEIFETNIKRYRLAVFRGLHVKRNYDSVIKLSIGIFLLQKYLKRADFSIFFSNLNYLNLFSLLILVVGYTSFLESSTTF